MHKIKSTSKNLDLTGIDLVAQIGNNFNASLFISMNSSCDS